MTKVMTQALLEAKPDEVVVSFTLVGEGALAEGGTYCIEYYGPDDNGGKKFAVVMSGDRASAAWVWDHASATQANYDGSGVTVLDDRIVARFRDASVGVTGVGTARAWSTAGGRDVRDLPAIVLL